MKTQHSFFIMALLLLIWSCTPKVYFPYSLNSPEFSRTYINYLGSDELVLNSWYHYMTSRRNDGKFIVRTFYPENRQMTSLATFTSQSFDVKDGISIKWADDGDTVQIGSYSDNMRVGLWKYYSKNNELFESGIYLCDKKEGVWKQYSKGMIINEINFENGARQGDFVEYDSLGTKINTGTYKDDILINQTKITDTVKDEEMPYLMSCSDLPSRPDREKCSSERLLRYIYSNLKYPAKAINYGVEGSAMILFEIDEEGKISNPDVRNGLCPAIKEECLRLVKNIPPFVPGKQKGKPVKVSFTLPIIFKLQ